MKKTLKQKFLDGNKLNLLDNLRLNISRAVSDCSGMCDKGNCNQWYCEIYKNNPQLNQNYELI